MTLAAGQVRVAANGEISIGVVGTAVAPTDATTALDASWTGLGYNTDAGLTLSRSVNVNDIAAWQSQVAVRKVPSDQAASVSGEFLQSNKDVAALYFATGLFAIAGAGPDFKASADVNPSLVVKAVVLQWEDAAITYRLYFPKCQVTANGDQTLTRTGAVTYPLTFAAIAPDTGTDLFDIFTSDPAITT